MKIIPTYESCVTPYITRFPVIDVSPENQQKLAAFLKNEYTRFLHKFSSQPTDLSYWRNIKQILLGEIALMEMLDFPLKPFKLTEHFSYRSEGIFHGDVRIKVFQEGTLPVVYKDNHKPIVFIMQTAPTSFHICGVASRAMLSSYQSADLVPKDEPKRDEKTVFYGFYDLRTFNNAEMLWDDYQRF